MGTIRYPGRLQDRVAVITGSSSGIGRAIALKFASEGAHIVCGDLKPEERDLKETPTHELILENSSSKAVFLKTDVREEQEVKALIDKAVSEFGRIDMLEHLLRRPITVTSLTLMQYGQQCGHWN